MPNMSTVRLGPFEEQSRAFPSSHSSGDETLYDNGTGYVGDVDGDSTGRRDDSGGHVGEMTVDMDASSETAGRRLSPL